MFGVLVVKDSAGTVGFLTAFSGNLAGSNSHEYFVPPIYDMLRPGDLFRTEEAAISDLNRQIETLETAGRYRELLRTIEETETEAGITIFLRSRTGITLTKDGAEFLGYARQVIQQMELLEDRYVTNLPGKVTSDRGKPSGVYRAIFSKASCFFAKRSPIGIEKSSFRP